MSLYHRIWFILLSLSFASGSDAKELYPFHENLRWGFIDKTGNRIVEPKFLSYGDQSGGLINVRENGKYGYIDSTGKKVIPFIFDYAEPFINGIARVFQDTIQFLINKKGEKLTSILFRSIIDYSNPNFIIFETYSRKTGVATLDNKLIFDTVYTGRYSISPLSNGRSIIIGIGANKDNYRDQYGVLDSLGNFIVPLGKYEYITDFKGDFALTSFKTGSDFHVLNSVIDKSGKLIFTLPPNHSVIEYRLSSDNLFLTLISKTPSYYEGAVNTRGKFIINNPEYNKIFNFYNKRSFAKIDKGYTYLIDENGKKINNAPYELVLLNYTGKGEDLENPFYENEAIVKLNGIWCLINRDGNVLRKFENITGDVYARRRNLIFFSKDYKDYGFLNLDNGSIFLKQRINFYIDSYDGSLIKFSENEEFGYMNLRGDIIWKEKKSDNILSILNIDFKRSASYSVKAHSFDLFHQTDIHSTDSSTKKILGYEGFQRNKINIKIGGISRSKFQNKFIGRDIYLYNTTKDTAFFLVDGSFLTMNLQAISETKEWKDIEWQMQGWCGNSYRTIYLIPNSYWKIVIPEYNGFFETKLRMKLNYSRGLNSTQREEVFSEEFSGCINPAQFWRSISGFDRGYEANFVSFYGN